MEPLVPLYTLYESLLVQQFLVTSPSLSVFRSSERVPHTPLSPFAGNTREDQSQLRISEMEVGIITSGVYFISNTHCLFLGRINRHIFNLKSYYALI